MPALALTEGGTVVPGAASVVDSGTSGTVVDSGPLATVVVVAPSAAVVVTLPESLQAAASATAASSNAATRDR